MGLLVVPTRIWVVKVKCEQQLNVRVRITGVTDITIKLCITEDSQSV